MNNTETIQYLNLQDLVSFKNHSFKLSDSKESIKAMIWLQKILESARTP